TRTKMAHQGQSVTWINKDVAVMPISSRTAQRLLVPAALGPVALDPAGLVPAALGPVALDPAGLVPVALVPRAAGPAGTADRSAARSRRASSRRVIAPPSGSPRLTTPSSGSPTP